MLTFVLMIACTYAKQHTSMKPGVSILRSPLTSSFFVQCLLTSVGLNKLYKTITNVKSQILREMFDWAGDKNNDIDHTKKHGFAS